MKRKTCASVLALILTCAMVTGSLPVEANAAEAFRFERTKEFIYTTKFRTRKAKFP